jgi:hypothetical protein
VRAERVGQVSGAQSGNAPLGVLPIASTGDVPMVGTTRLRFVALLKIPTKIAGTCRGGELVELRVRDRIADLIRPTSTVAP